MTFRTARNNLRKVRGRADGNLMQIWPDSRAETMLSWLDLALVQSGVSSILTCQPLSVGARWLSEIFLLTSVVTCPDPMCSKFNQHSEQPDTVKRRHFKIEHIDEEMLVVTQDTNIWSGNIKICPSCLNAEYWLCLSCLMPRSTIRGYQQVH